MAENERNEQQNGTAGEGNAESVPKSKKYRKPKPWDHEGIDHWKVSH